MEEMRDGNEKPVDGERRPREGKEKPVETSILVSVVVLV